MSRREWLTLPNLITVLRLVLLVPVCAMIIGRLPGPLSTVLVVVWAATDWLDGAVARRFGMESRVGRALDPIADRLGILAVAAALMIVGALPWLLLPVIALVDIVVALVAGRAAAQGTIGVHWLGKMRSAVLFVALALAVAGVSWLTVLGPIAVALAVIGTALHLLAGIQYGAAARRAATSLPAGAPRSAVFAADARAPARHPRRSPPPGRSTR